MQVFVHTNAREAVAGMFGSEIVAIVWADLISTTTERFLSLTRIVEIQLN